MFSRAPVAPQYWRGIDQKETVVQIEKQRLVERDSADSIYYMKVTKEIADGRQKLASEIFNGITDSLKHEQPKPIKRKRGQPRRRIP